MGFHPVVRNVTGITTEHLFKKTAVYAAPQTAAQLQQVPTSGNALYITDIVISNGNTAGTVSLVEDTDGAKTVVINKLNFAINGGAVINFQTPFKLTENEDLGITSTGVSDHSITIVGYENP